MPIIIPQRPPDEGQHNVTLFVYKTDGSVGFTRTYVVGKPTNTAKPKGSPRTRRVNLNEVKPANQRGQQQPARGKTRGSEADLKGKLAQNGYHFPDKHLSAFLEASHNEFLQIGVRRPFDEDQIALQNRNARISTDGQTLTFVCLVKAAQDLAKLEALLTRIMDKR